MTVTLNITLERFEGPIGFIRRMASRLENGAATTRGVEKAMDILVKTAQDVTHQYTGTLAASHAGRLTSQRGGDVSGQIYQRPFYNPWAHMTANQYSGYEHARGADHAFYQITMRHSGDEAAQAAGLAILMDIRNG